MFPVLLGRLYGAPARAEDLVAGAAENALSLRGEDSRWSVKEHLGHLSDLHALDQLRLGEFLAGAPVLSPADTANSATELAHHNQTPLEVLLRHFRSVRTSWVQELAKLEEADLSRVALHPRLKQKMKLVDWLYFIAEHDDHHLARALALLQSPAEAFRDEQS
jgi:uncharacterized damage-inducible protein DinB